MLTAERLTRLPQRVRRRLDPAARFGLRATLAALALALIAVPFSLLLLQVRTSGPLLAADRTVARELHEAVRDHRSVRLFLEVITTLGTFAGLGLAVVVAAVVLVRARRWRLLRFVLVTTIGGWLLNNAVKLAVARPRPTFDDPIFHARGLSFPSGHAMNSVVVLGALLLVFLPAVAPRRRTPVFAAGVLLVLLIGFSRLALGVHYLTDVVAGMVLGLAWLSACVALFSVWRVERGRAAVDALEGLEPESADALRAAPWSDGAATPER